MAFVSTIGAGTAELSPTVRTVAAAQNDFFLLDRFVLLCGGLALGTIAGFLALIALGRQPPIDLVVVGSMMVMVALNFGSQTLRESLAADARLCTIAAAISGAAMLCWPLVMVPVLQSLLWVAPAFAVLSLAVLTASWRGSSRAIYRVMLQSAIVAALAAYTAGLRLMS
ncbi:MAG: hypothetical protein JSS00_00865 [Proteobacteria bacterium]|nr:hypothetical protein [Pseudomonadota bacterium]